MYPSGNRTVYLCVIIYLLMEPKAFIIDVDFEKENIEAKLFKGSSDPISDSLEFKEEIKRLFPHHVVTIVANDEANEAHKKALMKLKPA